ncbi:hypothetical protein AB0J80_30475 [Actinoplanes sp. NPDC049548]|uniref:hypothetical protein n=1 Tax=Actinoplanes sp. NPDC049548 TaxID=3155152 RepID=UPI0034487E42
MPYLVAAVVLVGLLCLFDLLLTVGVIRRLRAQSTLLAGYRGAMGEVMMPTGSVVGDFVTTTVDSKIISRTQIDDSLVGFFSTSCEGCVDALETFVPMAKLVPGGRPKVLAVVVGDRSNAGKFVDVLSPVAQVVVEAEHGPMARAFEVNGYPAVAMVGAGGVLTAAGATIKLDPATAAA